MTETTVIDRKALDRLFELAGNDPDIVAEMMNEFFEDAPRFIAEMRSALERGSAGELNRAAHSFKSNSASFGAMALAQRCRELEMQGKAGTLEGAAEQIAEIEKEYACARQELESLRRTV